MTAECVEQVLSILAKSATLTVPAPRLEALKAVQYSQRFALAFLFSGEIATQVQALKWTSKYVSKEEDDVIRYLCWDNLKKQSCSPADSLHFALLVHTSVPFGVKHMDKKQQDDAIIATVSESLKKLLPFLPEEEDVILHRWRLETLRSGRDYLHILFAVIFLICLVYSRISQVTKPYSEAPSKSMSVLVLSESPSVVVAGDAFLGSNFDNCLLSAKAAAEVFVKGAISSGL